MNDPQKLLVIYLQDHDAASQAGAALARRCAASNAGNELGAYLRGEFIPQVDKEQESVLAALDAVDAKPSLVKRVATVAGEFVGRAKPNGRVWSYSPLSRIVELEGLVSGVHAKQRLWVTIDSLNKRGVYPALPDVSEHRKAADTQLAELQRHHERAVNPAFDPTAADDC